MSRTERIKKILTEKFHPLRIEVIDESHRHAAHGPSHPDSHMDDQEETHMRLIIVGDTFRGMSRIERQRVVHQVLDEEFQKGLHALTMKVLTPEEA